MQMNFSLQLSIPESEIDNLVSSFPVRCQICVNWNAGALNGHWKEVHALHNQSDPGNIPSLTPVHARGNSDPDP
jgi:hypothetical protein